MNRFTKIKLSLALALVGGLSFVTPINAQTYQFSQSQIAGAPVCSGYQNDLAAMICQCPAGSSGGSVWGSGPYTSDSNLCQAARHAGVIGNNGGAIIAERRDGMSSYSGSNQNGVSTANWGSYHTSFDVYPARVMLAACALLPDNSDEHHCQCPQGQASASVWGSGPYTSDSGICAAAQHAGAIGQQGGAVHILMLPGLESYRGSNSNGVSTSNWGSYHTSFTFNMN